MAEKILNTRIALKIDTLENWSKSTLGLKKGELAIATVPAGEGVTESIVRIKIGEDGVKTFNDLPWNLYAKASDVLNACKSEESLTAFVNNVIAGAGLASGTALTQLTGRVSTVEGEITTLKGDANTAGSIAKAIQDAIAALNLDTTYEKVGTAQGIVDQLNVTDTAITGKYVSAVSEEKGKITVTRADLPTYTLASGSANGTVSFNGADIAVTGLGSAAYTDSKAYDAAGSAATAKSDAIADAEGKINALRDGAVKDNADAITAIKDHATVDSFGDVMTEMAKYQIAGDYATKTEAQGYADAKDSAIAEAKKAGTDAAAALEEYKTANNAAVVLKADQTALQAEIDRAKAAEQANADAIELLTNGVDQDKVDSVKDLITYVEEHGPEVTGMKEDIANNTTAITTEASRAAQEEERLAGLIGTNATNIAKNAEDIAKLNASDGKVANASHADNADKLGNVDAADYLLKTDATGYADILTKTDAANTYQPKGSYASAEQGAKADTAVQPAALDNYYTKSAADAEFMNSTETGSAIDAKITALNLAATYEPIGAETRANAYADSLAGNYATAAQGAKADTALQEIKTTVGGGLKVTNNNQIDFDPDIVFVFNCGDAGVSNA